MTGRISRFAHLLVPLLALLVLSGVVLGPGFETIGSRFLGYEYVDHYGTQWFYWFVEYALQTGASLTHTDLFFYPWGKDIFGHTGSNVLDAFLALPFRAALGHIVGYNAFVIGGLLVSGWAFTRFALEFTEDRLAAYLGGVLFTFNPYALAEMVEGRPTQGILAPLVLFLHTTWRAGLVPGWGAPVAAGFMLATCGYQYWYYAFFAGMVCLAHGLWRTALPPADAGSRGAVFLRHVVIAAVALVLVSPVALPLALIDDSSGVPGLLNTADWTWNMTLPVTIEEQTIGLYLWQPFWGGLGFYVLTGDRKELFLVHQEVTPVVMWLAAAWALLRARALPGRGAWAAMLAMAMVLAVGPFLLVRDMAVPNPLYIVLAKSLGFLQRLWWPGRAYALIAVLLTLATTTVLGNLARRGLRVQLAAAALVIAAFVVDLRRFSFVPFPTWDASIPAGYRCLAQGPPGALIELPYSWTQAHLYYQVAHARPILGGMIENNPVFTPAESNDLREDNTYVATLINLSTMDPSERADLWTPEDKQAVYELGYRFVVLQKDAFLKTGRNKGLADNVLKTRLRQMRKQLQQLAGPAVYEDARVSIHAPWGDTLPCRAEDSTKDSEVHGAPDYAPEARMEKSPVLAGFRRMNGEEPPSTLVVNNPNAGPMIDKGDGGTGERKGAAAQQKAAAQAGTATAGGAEAAPGTTPPTPGAAAPGGAGTPP